MQNFQMSTKNYCSLYKEQERSQTEGGGQSVDSNIKMTDVSISEKYFKVVMIEVLQWTIMNMLEINEKQNRHPREEMEDIQKK